MAVKIGIGSTVVTINQGSTCMVTDLGGVGVHRIRSNGHAWIRLTSGATTYSVR